MQPVPTQLLAEGKQQWRAQRWGEGRAGVRGSGPARAAYGLGDTSL